MRIMIVRVAELTRFEVIIFIGVLQKHLRFHTIDMLCAYHRCNI